ncbi:MAG: FG-GAP repeat protein, partial [Gammaproteobacteria bacterium]|nr:FG-GAP repeat protein [Gammaproteobacteria bacterium]
MGELDNRIWPSFTAPGEAATLTFELTVTDNSGGKDTDTVNIIVPTDVNFSVTVPPPGTSQQDNIKTLRFIWDDAPDETHYQLMHNPDSISGYTQIGEDIPADSASHDINIAAHLLGWANARYAINICVDTDCIMSKDIGVDALENHEVVGYFKTLDTLPDNEFGSVLAFSEDGTTLAVGAPGPLQGGATAGSVYVFVRDPASGLWAQQGEPIKAPNGDEDDKFGQSVSLSEDGNTLAVGAYAEDSSATGVNQPGGANSNDSFSAGAAYVFTRTGDEWSFHSYIKASNTGSQDVFGTSVALSGDGETLAVGADGESSSARGVNKNDQQNDDDASLAGAVYVFTLVADKWEQQAYIK